MSNSIFSDAGVGNSTEISFGHFLFLFPFPLVMNYCSAMRPQHGPELESVVQRSCSWCVLLDPSGEGNEIRGRNHDRDPYFHPFCSGRLTRTYHFCLGVPHGSYSHYPTHTHTPHPHPQARTLTLNHTLNRTHCLSHPLPTLNPSPHSPPSHIHTLSHTLTTHTRSYLYLHASSSRKDFSGFLLPIHKWHTYTHIHPYTETHKQTYILHRL